MPLALCILASGSAGNCAVLRTPAGVMLIDAGIGPRTTARRLDGTGVAVADVRAICLTHLDRDHFNPHWAATLLARGIRLFCHQRRADELRRLIHRDIPISTFDGDAFEPLAGLSLRPLPLAHDELGSHGFLIDGFDQRIGYATDLGRVPHELIDRFADVDLLALESNYDPAMQEKSAPPRFLKQRIMGGRGHLSNQQAFEAIRAIFARSLQRGGRLPAHVVLLHRSRECNCPDLMRRLFSRDAHIARRLVLAEQFERSPWLCPNGDGATMGRQLTLAFG